MVKVSGKSSSKKIKNSSPSKVKSSTLKSKTKSTKISNTSEIKTKLDTKKKNHNSSYSSSILEESFNLIKKLNSQVKDVEFSKNGLKEQLAKFDLKLSKHESSSKDEFISGIKNEILNNFNPLLKKFNGNKLKEEILNQVNEIIDLEFSKLNSEFNLKSNKDKKEFSNFISKLDEKVLENVKQIEVVRKFVKENSKKEIKFVFEKIDLQIQNSNLILEKKFLNLINNNKHEFNSLKSKVDEISNKILDFKPEIDKIVADFENKLKQSQGTNNSNIEKNLLEFNNENSLKIEKLNSKITSISKQGSLIKKEFEEILKNEFKDFSDMNSKVEGLDKELSEVKGEIKNFGKIHRADLKREFSDELSIISSSLLEEFNEIKGELFTKVDESIENSNDIFDKRKDAIELNVSNFKGDLSEIVKTYVSHIEQRIKSSDDFNKNFEDRILKELSILRNKILKEEKKEHLDIGVLSEKLKEFGKKLNSIKKENKSDVKQIVMEEVSKNILKLNDFFSKVSKQIEMEKDDLHLKIENKFSNSLNQFENEFNSHLNEFDLQLQEKEKEFLNKLVLVENDKNLLIDELGQYKLEISQLTKDYVSKLDLELQKVKLEEKKFEDEKDLFSQEIKDLTNDELEVINTYARGLEENFNSLIKKQVDRFENNENTFREVFRDKVLNLHEYFKTRFTSIERKFVDKNLKIVSSKIKEELDAIELVREQLIIKKEEVYSKQEELDEKFNNSFSEIDKKKLDLEESIEKQYSNSEHLQSELKVALEKSIEELNKNILEQNRSSEELRESFKQNISSSINEVDKKKLDLEESIEKQYFNSEHLQSELKVALEKSIDGLNKNILEQNRSSEELKESFKQNISSSINEIENKKKEIGERIDEIYKESEIKQESLLQKSEERVMNLEKHFNKRFLGFETNFTSFKSVVIDEVEGFMGEIKSLINSKIEEFDKNISRTNQINLEAANRIQNISKIHRQIELEIRDMRSEIHDLKVKFDIVNYEGVDPKNSISSHIKYMCDYENQLIALIINLKEKGMPDNEINQILINKGHPRFYVSMIIRNFNKYL